MSNLPWFKFNPDEWQFGSITSKDMCTQGLFINICAYYWKKAGDVSFEDIKKKYGKFTGFDILSDSCMYEQHGKLIIKFLDIQLEENKGRSRVASEKGSKGAKAKSNNKAVAKLQLSHSLATAKLTQADIDIDIELEEEEERKYIKKENFSDFSGKENSLGPEFKNLNSPPTPSPEFFKKTKIDPSVEKSLKKLDKAGLINLAEIEEKFFPGQGTQAVILEFQKHFAKINYKWKSDQATLGCFGPWTNQLRTKTISAQLDAKIPEKPNLSDKQESEYAKFLKIRYRHGEIGNFLNLEPSEEKESLIRLLIAKYGLSELIRKIYEYSIQSTMGSTYNSISHFKAWEPNLKIPDKEWEEIVKGQELEEALKN